MLIKSIQLLIKGNNASFVTRFELIRITRFAHDICFAGRMNHLS